MQQAVRTKLLELRKFVGGANPLDFFTKLIISRARLKKLVALDGRRYAGRRAESAPHVRKGESTRFILADADLFTIDSPGDSAPELEPWIPPLDLTQANLDLTLAEFD